MGAVGGLGCGGGEGVKEEGGQEGEREEGRHRDAPGSVDFRGHALDQGEDGGGVVAVEPAECVGEEGQRPGEEAR